MKLWFHGLELDIHRTPDLSRAPDGAGMFEIRGVKVDDDREFCEFAEDSYDAPITDEQILAWVNKHHRAAIEAACEAEAGL